MTDAMRHVLVSVALGLLLCALPAHGGKAGGDVGDEVIAHYAKLGDAEKLRAARFLVSNMRLHSFKDSPLLDKYYAGIEQINKKYKYPACVEQYDRLYEELGRPADVKVRSDADALTAAGLIENIDMAFTDWRNGLWARHLTFDEFCEYLLPYRVGSEKVSPGWRKRMRDRYFFRAEALKTSDDVCHSAYWATFTVNETLKRLGLNVRRVLPQLDVDMPLQALDNIRMGECRDYSVFAAYVMRACGIPVGVDFTPQWPDRALNHYWNVVLDNTGKNVPFLGADSNPEYSTKPGQKMAKVYRLTFARQPQSLHALNSKWNERVPDVLNSPFMKDVSDEYFRGKNLYVPLNDLHRDDKFAYIAVFNNQEWVPVDFAVVNHKDRSATFKYLGCDVVYLPVYWGRNGCIPASDPILLPSVERARALVPNKAKPQTIRISRKYPLFRRVLGFRRMMKGGVFEAANSPDFSDAVRCAVIKGVPLRGYDTLAVSGTDGKLYRYWRYVAPKNRKCEVAEISFLAAGKEVETSSILCGGKADVSAGKAFDGDKLSYYGSASAKDAWVGADMGRPVAVDRIAYIPRNDDNDVVPGHTYELSYFDGGVQKSAGVQTATSGTLVFENVPSGALYILHHLDGGTEERIFTYEDGKINWY